MTVCGIDPGLSGAICLLSDTGRVVAIGDMPTHTLPRAGKHKREIDVAQLANLIVGIDHAFVERVGAMPGQGTASMFAFGKAYGIVIGILAARQSPVSFVAPTVWKRALQVPAAKDGARARASQLMPAAAAYWPLKRHADRAEAAFLALLGLRALRELKAAA